MPQAGGSGGVSAGATSVLVDIFLQDSSSTTGAGLTGLTFSSSGLTAYYHRNADNASVAITLATMTLGTWATGGFIVVDGTNMPGLYQIGVPNAAFAAGSSTEVTLFIKGATNLAPKAYKIPIIGANNTTENIRTGTLQSATSTTAVLDSGASAVDNFYQFAILTITGGTGAGQSRGIASYVGSSKTATVSAWSTTPDSTSTFAITPAGQVQVISYLSGQAPLQPTTAGRTLDVSAGGGAGVDWANVKSPTTTLDLSGTTIKNVDNAIANVTTVGSVTGAVGSVTGAVGSVTGNVGGNVTGSVGSVVGLANTVWNETLTASNHNVNNSAGKILRLINPTSDVVYPTSGTVNIVSATSTTATLDALASNVAQAYQWDVLSITGGTGAGQSRVISNYTTGRVATLLTAWATTPDATSTFEITPTGAVEVVNYASGQDPGSLVLITPANKLLTDASGRVDVSALAGSATAGTRLKNTFVAAPQGTVDTATFSPTTSSFETSFTVNQDQYTKQALLWVTGANAGLTVQISAYLFTNAKVHLTTTVMPNAPSNGDTFVILGKIGI